MHYREFRKFVKYLKKSDRSVYIQPHNFPDPDALASSYGLKKIFDFFGIKSKIIYFGPKLSLLNKELIDIFEMEIEQIDKRKIYENKIGMDGHPENINFMFTKGKFIGYFDHHIQKEPLYKEKKYNFQIKNKNNIADNNINNINESKNSDEDNIFFQEVDSKIGSTSTIISHYILHYKIPVTKKMATFLNIGIYTDTKGLSRKTSLKDLNIFKNFYFKMDMDIFSFFTGNSFEKKDIKYLNEAINNLKIKEDRGITFVEGNISPSLLGIIADTIIRIIEINFVLIIGFIGNSVYLSTRSISSKYNCFEYFKNNLTDKAYFGGHNEMAGGQFIDKKLTKKEIFDLLDFA